MPKPRLAIVHDLRRKQADGKAPVRLRVTFKVRVGGKSRWVQKYYGEAMRCTAREFASMNSANRSEDMKEIKEATDLLYSNAKKAVAMLPDDMSIELFESRFLGIALDTVNGCFAQIIEDLRVKERIGTAKANQTALNCFKSFVLSPKVTKDTSKEILEDLMARCEIRFSDVTPIWLGEFEDWVLKGGGAVNSVGMHLRALRAVFNYAIGKGVIPSTLYPFSQYTIRSEMKYKIPVGEKELEKIKSFVADTAPVLKAMADLREREKEMTPRQFYLKMVKLEVELRQVEYQALALDFWKFSYYCNGMNMRDIAGLRHSDIHDEEFILYDRAKTRRTKIRFKKIIIPIDHEIMAIIRRRGARTLDPEGYVFPILIEELKELTIKNRVSMWTENINKGLKAVSNKLELKKKLTMVIARHTFGNRMSNLGADGRMLQEQLGHQKAETTEHYRGSLYSHKIRKTREGL